MKNILLTACGAFAIGIAHGADVMRDRYFGLHFDFHASPEKCAGVAIGETLAAEDIEWICRELKPDFIQTDCKGHPGWTSYPTALGNAMPAFKGDPLRLWRDVTKEFGIGLYMHYSGVVDRKYVADHPEEQTKGPDGSPNGWFSTRTNGRYADDLMIPQLKELAGKYGVDGVWVDGECWGASADFDPRTVAQFEKETGIDLKGVLPARRGQPHFDEYRTFCRELFKRYLRHYVDAVHADYPRFRIASNWCFTDHMPEKVSANVDFLSGDVDPDDSFSSARYAARAVARQGMPWDLMSWGFRWSKFYTPGFDTPKHVVQLEQEAAAIISLGGGYQVYSHQRRDGSPAMEQIRAWKPLSDFVRARREWCFGGESVRQVAVLLSTHDRNIESEGLYQRTGCTKVKGVVNLLCDAGHSNAIVSEFNFDDEIDWPVVWVPELFDGLEQKTVRRLLDYAHDGGSLVLAGVRPCEIFAAAGAPFKTQDMARRCWRGYSADGHSFGVVTGTVALVSYAGEVLARYAPGADAAPGTDVMAVLCPHGKGRIVAVGADIGTSYHEAVQGALCDFARSVLSRLYRPLVEVRHVVGTLEINDLRKDGKLLVQLVNANGRHRAMTVLTEDSLPPVLDVELAVRQERKPTAIRLQPAGLDLDFNWADGVAVVRVPKVDVHAVVEIVVDADGNK